MMRAVVLTISDSGWRGERVDRSGPAVKERLESLGWQVAPIEVIPDEAASISSRLSELADEGAVDAIFTTGGTGVAARDVTPEATLAVLEKEIPGLGEQMRAEGRKKTKLAALSRATAGTRARTLIVNLPGSPKGAVESLDAIVELAPHIVDLLRGKTEHPPDAKLDVVR
ncbi:MAG: MogA/MoaB family molybdenum cofactor biosynthesis protein [Bryobacteraceae bacterium]